MSSMLRVTVCRLAIVLGWILAWPVKGQMAGTNQFENPQGGYFLRIWDPDEGLPDTTVCSVVQTKDGYLWLATYSGLARFDGVHFTVFTTANTPEMASDRITSLYEDEQGRLWIGHERGDLTLYEHGRFEVVQNHESGKSRKICAMQTDASGDLWVMNEEGVLTRVRDGLTCELPNHVGSAAMVRDNDGQIWVASGGYLAPLVNDRLIPLTDRGTNGFCGYYVAGICASHEGGLWVASDGRVRHWKNKRWVADLGTNPCPTTVTAMCETRSGSVAMGSVESGLNILNPSGGRIHFGLAEGFPHDWIRCIWEDKEGTLWVGAGNGGLVAVRRGRVSMVVPPDHFEGRVPLSTAAGADGSVWVTTEGAGLYQYLNGRWNHYGLSSGLANVFVWCVTVDRQGQVWAGTWGNGMFISQGNGFVPPRGLETNHSPMAALFQARDGAMWIGTADGLVRWLDGKVEKYGQKEGLQVPDVRAIGQTLDGTLWFGMMGGGLGSLKNGEMRVFTRADGLSSDFVQCLHVDTDGALWIGTYGGGMSRLKNGRFHNYSLANWPPGPFICNIEEDDFTNLWVSSTAGIFRITLKSLAANADLGKPLEILGYGRSEGMATERCSGGMQPAACRTADGRLWFTTEKGLAVIHPDHASFKSMPAPVKLESVQVDGQPLAWDPGSRSPLLIEPGWNRLEFQFTALSFVAPEEIQFQYRLDGWDSAWVDGGTKRVCDYNFLPPGDYVFRVRARNHDGGWDSQDARLAFVALPHLWQTWWFHLASVLSGASLLGCTVWIVSRRRMRRKLEIAERQQALEKERTRIAKDIHDHLGANLTRISLLSQSAHGDLDLQSPAAAQLERIFDTARELTRSMDEIVWAVNPHHDTLDSLASYLGHFAQEYLVPLGLRCRLEMPLQLPLWPISAETRHNVFLAFKETLHNVVKHAGATEVSVHLALMGQAFQLTIQDNGRGFDTHSRSGRAERGNGLKNIRQRMVKNGGTCEIHSSPGQGTRVVLCILPDGRESVHPHVE